MKTILFTTLIILFSGPSFAQRRKADKDTKMGIITDVKQELRKANALKINYSTRKRVIKN